tara:strand:- start:148 stop:309 length:162 start_codon:yes stop_codon:yes gene_type:complete
MYAEPSTVQSPTDGRASLILSKHAVREKLLGAGAPSTYPTQKLGIESKIQPTY